MLTSPAIWHTDPNDGKRDLFLPLELAVRDDITIA